MECSVVFPSEKLLKENLAARSCDPQTAAYLSHVLAGRQVSASEVHRSVDSLTANRKENFLHRRIFLALREASNYREDAAELSFPDSKELKHRLTHLNRNTLKCVDQQLKAIVIEHFAGQAMSENELKDNISWLIVEDTGHYNRASYNRRSCMALSHVASRPIEKPTRKKTVQPQTIAMEKFPTKSPSVTLSDSQLGGFNSFSPTVC